MATLDELKEHKTLFEVELRRGLRPASRPSPILANNGKTCRDCQHAIARQYSKTYYKCGLNRERWTQGIATDIRLKDPACEKFELEKPKEQNQNER